jgi:two-component system response regulator HupR/HoxA
LAEVAAGRFRRDLYYRLAAFPIPMPARRDRPMDISVSAARLLRELNQAFRRKIPGFAPETLRLMAVYDWPGNVREMHNEVQRIVALFDSEQALQPDLHSPAIRNGRPDGAAGDSIAAARISPSPCFRWWAHKGSNLGPAD